MKDEATHPFQRIGILHHPRKPDSLHLAEQMEKFLRQAGVNEIWRNSAWDANVIKARLPDVDLLITLGGDGTMLRAARLGAAYNVPMLGVKMGRLGFLAEIFPQDWRSPLEQLLQGDYWIEERLMVRALVEKVSDAPCSGGTRRPDPTAANAWCAARTTHSMMSSSAAAAWPVSCGSAPTWTAGI